MAIRNVCLVRQDRKSGMRLKYVATQFHQIIQVRHIVENDALAYIGYQQIIIRDNVIECIPGFRIHGCWSSSIFYIYGSESINSVSNKNHCILQPQSKGIAKS